MKKKAKKYEDSKADKKRDKKLGIKENSKKDKTMDAKYEKARKQHFGMK